MMLACASMTSIAVVRSTPEMVVIAMHCMDASLFITLTDLVALARCDPHITGAYQTSAAYMNFGIATAQ